MYALLTSERTLIDRATLAEIKRASLDLRWIRRKPFVSATVTSASVVEGVVFKGRHFDQ